MSWRTKELYKHQARKLAKDAINSREYKELRRKEEQEIALRTYVRFCLVACDYIQINFGCKKRGIMKALVYFAGIMKYISNEDDNYFIDMNNVMIDECGTDVVGLLNMKIEEILKSEV